MNTRPGVRLTCLSAILASLFANSCQPAPSPSYTPASPVLPTPTTLPSFPSPSRSPSARSTQPRGLDSQGPWIVGGESTGVWVTNSDLSGETWVTHVDPERQPPPNFVLAPNGTTLAVAVAHWPDASVPGGCFLQIFDLPDLTPVTEVDLFSQAQLDYIAGHFPPWDPDLYNFGESAAYQRGQVVAAITARDSIAWAPDSSRLAFVAAIDGPTSDVYILDIPTGQLTRASFGNAQAGHLHWSPDGAYVVHQAVGDYNIGRSGTDLIDSLWSATPDGGSPRLLIDGPAFVLGWISPRMMLAYLWQMQCDYYYLVAVDLPSATFTPLRRGPLSIDWQGDQDFSVAIPPPSNDTDPKDPWFEEWCSPPGNPAADVDLSAVPGLPISVPSLARTSTILIASREGSVSITELAPTMTPIPTSTPTPRAPAPP